MNPLTKRTLIAGGIAAVLAAAISQLGLTAAEAEGYTVKYLTPADIAASGALVVDIRAPDEWAQTGVIDGAALVTFSDPTSFLASISPQIADGRDLVLVCHSGRRSAAAAEALSGMISNKIISLDGGMSAVIAGGYQTVAPN